MIYTSDSLDEKIIALLNAGAVGVLPSDTIYGLSCRALDKDAVERIYKLKRRSDTKPAIVLISNQKMLDLLSIDTEQLEPIKGHWPGPLSVILDAPKAPAWLLRGGTSLAVRWPEDSKLTDLIDRTGPLISTSANPEGGTPATSIDDAKNYFGDKSDFYIDIGKLDNQPSTLVEIKDGRPRIVRQGVARI